MTASAQKMARESATLCCTQIDSPVGPLLLAGDDAGLREIRFVAASSLTPSLSATLSMGAFS